MTKFTVKNLLKNKYVLIPFAVLLSLLFIIFYLFSPSENLDEVLNPKNYEMIQVKVTAQSRHIGEDKNTDSVSGGADNTLSKENAQQTVIMQKDGDVICESGNSGKYYFYTRDGKGYVLFYDTMYGIREEGLWTEAPRESFNLKPSFDVSCLQMLSKDDFQKKGSTYVPKSQTLGKAFFTLLGIAETNRTRYTIQDMKLLIKKNRLLSISADYIFSSDYSIKQTITFTYNNVKLKLPEVQKQYNAK